MPSWSLPNAVPARASVPHSHSGRSTELSDEPTVEMPALVWAPLQPEEQEESQETRRPDDSTLDQVVSIEGLDAAVAEEEPTEEMAGEDHTQVSTGDLKPVADAERDLPPAPPPSAAEVEASEVAAGRRFPAEFFGGEDVDEALVEAQSERGDTIPVLVVVPPEVLAYQAETEQQMGEAPSWATGGWHVAPSPVVSPEVSGYPEEWAFQAGAVTADEPEGEEALPGAAVEEPSEKADAVSEEQDEAEAAAKALPEPEADGEPEVEPAPEVELESEVDEASEAAAVDDAEVSEQPSVSEGAGAVAAHDDGQTTEREALVLVDSPWSVPSAETAEVPGDGLVRQECDDPGDGLVPEDDETFRNDEEPADDREPLDEVADEAREAANERPASAAVELQQEEAEEDATVADEVAAEEHTADSEHLVRTNYGFVPGEEALEGVISPDPEAVLAVFAAVPAPEPLDADVSEVDENQTSLDLELGGEDASDAAEVEEPAEMDAIPAEPTDAADDEASELAVVEEKIEPKTTARDESLLETATFGRLVDEDVAGEPEEPEPEAAPEPEPTLAPESEAPEVPELPVGTGALEEPSAAFAAPAAAAMIVATAVTAYAAAAEEQEDSLVQDEAASEVAADSEPEPVKEEPQVTETETTWPEAAATAAPAAVYATVASQVQPESAKPQPSKPTDRPRSVLVTGASRGIGRAVAQAMLDAGEHVVGLSRSGEAPDGALGLAADVTDKAAINAAVAQAEAENGPIEVLVACAGIARDSLAARTSDATWESMLETDLTGVFRTVRAVLPQMMRARSGRIILVSSVVASRGGVGQVAYGAAKAGVEGLVRSLARELAPRGITVNAVAPGFVATDMTNSLPAVVREAHVAATPIGRMATPQEIAAPVVFLASPQASYITGTVLPVDGGLGMGR